VRVAFIGDIVGKPARNMIKHHLKNIKKNHNIDFVIANFENASHGFGLTVKNANELFNYGIDFMTGGNHTWDKKDIFALLERGDIIRPLNYPDGVKGDGLKIIDINGESLAIINLMGHFSMPMVSNPFITAKECVDRLISDGITNIFIDFHAEATAEKRGLLALLRGKVSAICGTHTHTGTDDLVIENGTLYVTDVGLTGCRTNVIGMEEPNIIQKILTGLPTKYEIPNSCRAILQMIVVDIDNSKAKSGFKIKAYDNKEPFISQEAFIEIDR
jgi:hypothetical protein